MSFSYASTSFSSGSGENELIYVDGSGNEYPTQYAYVVNDGVATLTFHSFDIDVGGTATTLTTKTGLPNHLLPKTNISQSTQVTNNGDADLGYVSLFLSGTMSITSYDSTAKTISTTFTNVSGYASFSISYLLKRTPTSDLSLDFGTGTPLNLKYVKNGNNVVINGEFETSWGASSGVISGVTQFKSNVAIPTELIPVENVTVPVLGTYDLLGTIYTIFYFTIFGAGSADAGKVKFNSNNGAPFQGTSYSLIFRTLMVNYYVGDPIYQSFYKWPKGLPNTSNQIYNGNVKKKVCNVVLDTFVPPYPILTATPLFNSVAGESLTVRLQSSAPSATFIPFSNAPSATYNTCLCAVKEDGTLELYKLDNSNFTAGNINISCTTVGSDDLRIVQYYVNAYV